MCKLNREGFQTPKLPFPVRVCREGGTERTARHGTARRGGRRLIIARWPAWAKQRGRGSPRARRGNARTAHPRDPCRPICPKRSSGPRAPAPVGALPSAASAPTRRAPPGARRRDRGGPAVLPSCVAGRATMCCAVQALGRWLATWPGARRCPSEAPPIRI